MPAFAFVAVASPLHDVQGPLAAVTAALAAAGGVLRTDEALDEPASSVVLLVATGGVERAILERVARRRRAVPNEPVVLVAHPGHNSLPAALEVLGRLRQDAVAARVVYLGPPGDARGRRALEDALGDLAAWRALRAARIGLVGEPSDWLVASSPSAETVAAAWGPQVVPIPWDALAGALDDVPPDEARGAAEALIAGAAAVREPDRAAIVEAARVTGALRRLATGERLDAVAVRCFDLVLGRRTTGCLALARLNDEGTIAACEADLVSAVGMLLARAVLGATPWMANPARLDEERGTLTLAHCTVPLGLTASYELRSHFESGLGVALAGRLPAGPVTLVRLGGRRLERLWLAEGEARGGGDDPDLCRTQLDVRLDRGSVAELLTGALGNHVVVVPGRHAARLRAWREGMESSRAAAPSGVYY